MGARELVTKTTYARVFCSSVCSLVFVTTNSVSVFVYSNLNSEQLISSTHCAVVEVQLNIEPYFLGWEYNNYFQDIWHSLFGIMTITVFFAGMPATSEAHATTWGLPSQACTASAEVLTTVGGAHIHTRTVFLTVTAKISRNHVLKYSV